MFIGWTRPFTGYHLYQTIMDREDPYLSEVVAVVIVAVAALENLRLQPVEF
jgi:ABC-type Co2+ transport system permease subunit